MKGLLLNSIAQNKTFYIVTLCEFAAIMALIIGIFGNYGSNPDILSVAILIPYLGMLFIPITLSEGISGRKIQKMLECGFLKYTLTSGVSKVKYAVAETVESVISVQDVLDEFEGVGQVVLMTVHKSKGLEFHTMIFYGLDNKTWWSLKPDRLEELNTFFVALTRARQRAFFSQSVDKGASIAWIQGLLAPVGVKTIDGSSILVSNN